MRTSKTGILIIIGVLFVLSIPLLVYALRAWWDTAAY